MLFASGIVLFVLVMLIGTNELLAKMLPEISEIKHISCMVKEDANLEYTGKKIEPLITELTLEEANGKIRVIKSDEFEVLRYLDNVDPGMAQVEIIIDGYRGATFVKDAFQIRLGKLKGIDIVSASREQIELRWKKVACADGYIIYKSVDGGQTYQVLGETLNSQKLLYKDVDIQFNASYQYKICAYQTEADGSRTFGLDSDVVKQATPLATVVLNGVVNQSYNTLQVQWSPVAGAVGYQIFRSGAQDGTYEHIAELEDGNASAYNDATCSCGIPYYYYIKAVQSIDSQKIYGDASGIVSGATTPNRVGISGKTTDDNTKVTLNWKKSMGASGYEVYRKKEDASNYTLIKKIESADILSWYDAGLNKQDLYYYKIRPYYVLNHSVIYGGYSGSYEKDVTYVYSGPTISGNMSFLTQYVGRPYVFGGTSSTRGWDCSAFVQYVYEKHFGFHFNDRMTSAKFASSGTTISKSDRASWKAGDLLLYKEKGRISHVAIYLGNGQMIHALNSKYDTLIQDVDFYETWDKKTSLSLVKRYF